jgi:citrate lyase beta subunit
MDSAAIGPAMMALASAARASGVAFAHATTEIGDDGMIVWLDLERGRREGFAGDTVEAAIAAAHDWLRSR